MHRDELAEIRAELAEIREEIDQLMIEEPIRELTDKEHETLARLIIMLEKMRVTYNGDVARETVEYLIRAMKSFMPTTH